MFQTNMGRRWRHARRITNWGTRRTEQGFYGDNYFSPKFPRKRQREFVRCMATRLVEEWDSLCAMRYADAKRRMVHLGAFALIEAGYSWYRKANPLRKDGEVHRGAQRQVRYLMGMPRVQAGLVVELEAAGCGPSEAAREIAKIALGKIEAKTDEKAVRLRALDMIVRMTVGYVPTKAVSLHGEIKPDQFFDENEFQATPPIAAQAQEPKNVTPGNGGKRRRGRHR